jgi:phospholipase C
MFRAGFTQASITCGVGLALLACSPVAHERAAVAGRRRSVTLVDTDDADVADVADVGAASRCPSPVRADPMAAQRAACVFGASTSVAETLGFSPPERATIPLRHLIVIMKENRSYDHLFGKLFENGQPDSEPLLDTVMNPDSNGNEVHPYHADTTCLAGNPGHQWSAMHQSVDNGAMDGFVKASHKRYVMSWYDSSDLPFYYFLANTFAIGDRHFASVLSGTWPNRDYLLLATSDKVHSTKGGTLDPSLPTIFAQLSASEVSWGVYYGAVEPFEGSLGWKPDHPGVATFDVFLQQLADGTLPQVAFVDAGEGSQDEHPPADIQNGEAWTHLVYQSALASPLWSSLAIVLTYDEGGGFYDHVAPPHACLARPQDHDFFELGVRVPLVVISRFARAHYVSHVQHEHTSILRLVQLVFDLPALTARDANSDALLDMFDFECPNDELPAAPDPGQGGCK